MQYVLRRRGRPPRAIECKWSAGDFDARNLAAFRQAHPGGDNFIVARDVRRAYRRTLAGVPVEFVGLDDLIARLMGSGR